MTRRRYRLWEKTIDELLGDENPCSICLVKVTCSKSFQSGTACEPLQEKINEVLERVRNENKS